MTAVQQAPRSPIPKALGKVVTAWQLEAATHLATALALYDAHADELGGVAPVSEARAVLTQLSKPTTTARS